MWTFNGAASALTRPSQFPAGSTTHAWRHKYFFVNSGTVNGGTIWRCNVASAGGAIDTVSLPFVKLPLSEKALTLSDVTTNNASASAHGFLPKLDNTGTKYLRDDGTWQTVS